MKSKLRIGFDTDGVIVDFVTPFLEEVKKKYGTLRKHEEIYLHDMSLAFGISKVSMNELVTRVLDRGMWPLVPGFLENFKRVAHNSVHILTARKPGYAEETQMFLRKSGVRFDSFRNVEFPKYDHVDSCEFDVFVEDELIEAINLPESVGKVYLLDYP